MEQERQTCSVCGYTAEASEFKESGGCPRCNAPLCMIEATVEETR